MIQARPRGDAGSSLPPPRGSHEKHGKSLPKALRRVLASKLISTRVRQANLSPLENINVHTAARRKPWTAHLLLTRSHDTHSYHITCSRAHSLSAHPLSRFLSRPAPGSVRVHAARGDAGAKPAASATPARASGQLQRTAAVVLDHRP